MAKRNKKILLAGVIFLIVSFICVILVFYLMGTETLKSVEKSESLKEQVTMLKIEKSNKEDELSDVKSQLNKIDLTNLLATAHEIYDEDEKARREGLLWVDKESNTYIITLGALNGLTPGDRLSVIDEGSNEVGVVVVDIPLDVISYVQPVDESFEVSEDNQYQVIME